MFWVINLTNLLKHGPRSTTLVHCYSFVYLFRRSVKNTKISSSLQTISIIANRIKGAIMGVTRLDSTRGKKQVWRRHVRTWGLSEVNVLGAPIMIRRPWNCAPLAPVVTPRGAIHIRLNNWRKRKKALWTVLRITSCIDGTTCPLAVTGWGKENNW